GEPERALRRRQAASRAGGQRRYRHHRDHGRPRSLGATHCHGGGRQDLGQDPRLPRHSCRRPGRCVAPPQPPNRRGHVAILPAVAAASRRPAHGGRAHPLDHREPTPLGSRRRLRRRPRSKPKRPWTAEPRPSAQARPQFAALPPRQSIHPAQNQKGRMGRHVPPLYSCPNPIALPLVGEGRLRSGRGPEAVSRRTATRVTPGAISFSRSSHFAASAYSYKRKPVTLPPGRARLATKPEPTGSMALTKTIGTVRVA